MTQQGGVDWVKEKLNPFCKELLQKTCDIELEEEKLKTFVNELVLYLEKLADEL